MLSEQREFATPPPLVSRRLLWLLVAAGVLAIAVLVARQIRGRLAALSSQPHPAVGRPLEHLALAPLTGTDQPLTLADLSGKVALINIWGTWCGPCVIEFPHLVELEQHYRGRDDFRFVSVSCSGDGDDTGLAKITAAFLKEQRADFPTYADPDYATRDAIAHLAGESGVPYPTTLILGRDGRVKGLWFGYRDGLTDEMREVSDAALAQKK